MEKIDRLYALLERSDVDEDTKAAIRWAIFELEGRQKNERQGTNKTAYYSCDG